jgi:hypothetical protein
MGGEIMRFLVSFFFKNAFRSKRVFWMAMLGLVPFAVGIVLTLLPRLVDREIDPSNLFLELGFLLHISILLPLASAFIGSGAVADEVEEGTLPYIITRPVPKWRFVVSKVLAGFIVTGMILTLSLWVTYTVMSGAAGLTQWISGLTVLMRVTGVLLLGTLAYVSLFGLLGALMTRPVLYGLVFAFGWEKVVAHLPMRLKFFTIVTYLNGLYPGYTQGGTATEETVKETLGRILSGGDTPAPMAALILLLIALSCTALTALFLYVREYGNSARCAP